MYKNIRNTIQPIYGGDKVSHAFPKGISPKVNVIARSLWSICQVIMTHGHSYNLKIGQ